MVLGGDDKILHPGIRGGRGPLFRIVQIGVKVAEILVVHLRRDPFVAFQPFVSCAKRVQSPVNEHTKAVMPEPLGVARRFCRRKQGQVFQSHTYLHWFCGRKSIAYLTKEVKSVAWNLYGFLPVHPTILIDFLALLQTIPFIRFPVLPSSPRVRPVSPAAGTHILCRRTDSLSQYRSLL